MGGWPIVCLALLFVAAAPPEQGESASESSAASKADAKPAKSAAKARAAKRAAAAAPAADLPEHAVGDLSALKGPDAVLYFNAGEPLRDVSLVSFASGRGQATFKSVTVQAKEGDKKRVLRAAALSRIELGNKPYAVRFAPQLKGHVLIDLTARDVAINARLQTQRQRLWPELTDAEREAAVNERKVFFFKAQAAYPQLQFHETKYFLFYTDLPAAKLAPFIRDLDTMYARLATSFGVPAGKNIWLGKAVIVMFLGQADMWRFDQEVLKAESYAGYQARCHCSTDGHVVISGWIGDDPAVFAHTLVHETAHGFLWRHRSTVHIPSWINEGVADWIAGVVAPASRGTPRAQELAVKQLRQTGSAGGDFFTATNVTGWQYGLASSLVEYLLRTDAAAYRQFIDGIKEGATPEESLQAAYGLTCEQLLANYGRQIGVPRLTP
jgi:hypothetical protein